VARADVRLFDEATMRFRENGLEWRAEETIMLRNRSKLVGS
jgi:hypothetical protein